MMGNPQHFTGFEVCGAYSLRYHLLVVLLNAERQVEIGNAYGRPDGTTIIRDQADGQRVFAVDIERGIGTQAVELVEVFEIAWVLGKLVSAQQRDSAVTGFSAGVEEKSDICTSLNCKQAGD